MGALRLRLPWAPRLDGKQVAATIERTASSRRDGEIVGFETVSKYVTADLAYVVEVERLESKVGGREDITPYALRP